jgi:hypothetical protein
VALKEIDRIISEVNELTEKERIILLKKIENLYTMPDKDTEETDPLQAVFGLWKEYDINKKTLREKAWRKD